MGGCHLPSVGAAALTTLTDAQLRMPASPLGVAQLADDRWSLFPVGAVSRLCSLFFKGWLCRESRHG
jgi:hypothetical protein